MTCLMLWFFRDSKPDKMFDLSWSCLCYFHHGSVPVPLYVSMKAPVYTSISNSHHSLNTFSLWLFLPLCGSLQLFCSRLIFCTGRSVAINLKLLDFCVFLGCRCKDHAQNVALPPQLCFSHLSPFVYSNSVFISFFLWSTCKHIDLLWLSGLHLEHFFYLVHAAKPKSNSSSSSRAQKNNSAQQRNKKQVGVPASYTRGHHTQS